jgi:membrane protein
VPERAQSRYKTTAQEPARHLVLPDATLYWADVLVGAVVTALLFNVGKLLIGLYLSHSAVASSYGAAGALIIVLLWIYYSAQIFGIT